MDFTFKKLGKIIEGYIELLNIFPQFSTLTIENIESSDSYISVTFSIIKPFYNLTPDMDMSYKWKPEQRKMSITVAISTRTDIIKDGDNDETKHE